VSGAGARLLAEMLAAPLTDPPRSTAGSITSIISSTGPPCATRCATSLRRCPDIARACRASRWSRRTAHLASIATAWPRLPKLAARFCCRMDLRHSRAGHEDLAGIWGEHGPLVERLKRALAEEMPLQARDGGFVRAGYQRRSRRAARLARRERQKIAALQAITRCFREFPR